MSPVAAIVSVPVIAWRHPHCMWIRTRRPIPFAPAILTADRFIESVDPRVIRSGDRRPYDANMRRRWRSTQFNADTDTDGWSGEHGSSRE
jgi:hypothetical protein